MKPSFLLLLAAVLAACATNGSQVPDDAGGAFVTLLGEDTVAVERFQRTPLTMSTDVVLRVPRTTIRHYEIEVDGFGNLQRYEATIRVPEAPSDTPPLRREVVRSVGDTLTLTVTERGSTQVSTIAAAPNVLPFIDMVHWPFELMLRRAKQSGRDSLRQDMFSGQGVMPFLLMRDDTVHYRVQHPFRGTMVAQVDSAGALHVLDARSTTRKLVVRRVPDVDLEGLLRRFAAFDAAGRSFGDLSGRGAERDTVGGAVISIDYGRPVRRGREIFGNVVPYGEVWRTGANLATHFETNRAVTLGDLRVPAGRYTLFSIPRVDGGTLIVNRQTEQAGTSYDPARDLGRTEMRLEFLPSPVETLSFDIEETPVGGLLVLQWDRNRYVAPITVE